MIFKGKQTIYMRNNNTKILRTLLHKMKKKKKNIKNSNITNNKYQTHKAIKGLLIFQKNKSNKY